MSRPHVDVDRAPAPSFGLADRLEPAPARWHAHARHQLLYAAAGAITLEIEASQWLLPPQRAAWITAGARHRVHVRGEAELRTVYLDSAFAAPSSEACRVFSVSPLAREMLLEAMRWGPERSPSATADTFFAALAALAIEWGAAALPFRLPAAKSPELARAMEYALTSLSGSLSITVAAKRAGLSARSLNRRFSDEAQTTWRAFVQQARMLRATEILARPGARVTDAAIEVGFESMGAFTRAFEAFLGETPAAFKRKAQGG
jgi:AraC-like DNA-binding protein